MQRRGKSQGDRSIEDLAFSFLNGKYSMRGIINKFGWTRAMAATAQMADTLLLCDPDNAKAKSWSSMSKKDLLK